MSQLEFSHLLKQEDAHATPLAAGLFDEFGVEWLEWEPDTLHKEISDYWKVEVPPDNIDKIWALATNYTSDIFQHDVNGFVNVCNALDGKGANFHIFEPASIQSICWAITETLINDPDKIKFRDDVEKYIIVRLDYEGFHRVPKMLKDYVEKQDYGNEVNTILAENDIDSKEFWDRQTNDLIKVDQYIQENLIKMLHQLSTLKLKNVKPGAQQELFERISHNIELEKQRLHREEAGVAHKTNIRPIL